MVENIWQFIKFEITMSDIIGWILAALGGAIIYMLIDSMQTKLERHTMVKEIENEFSNIYNSEIAKACRSKKDNKLKQVTVRSVLHDEVEWCIKSKTTGKIKKKIVDSQFYIQIRNCKSNNSQKVYYNEWISTQALHEILIHCRRIEKLYKDGIIKRIDLADLYREILPLGLNGRMEAFLEYYNVYDVESIAYLVMQTVVSCEKYQNMESVKKFVTYYAGHNDIQKYFTKGKRIRKIRDFWSVRKFKKICRTVMQD